MRKLLKPIFINNYKNIFSLLSSSNSKYFEIKSIKFKIKKNCKIGNKNEEFISRVDEIITPNVLQSGEWDYFIIKFIKKKIKKNIKYNFFDVGANIGLITRQLIKKKFPFNKYICIEPEINNFTVLKKNLETSSKINLFNIGLSDKNNHIKKIYINEKNFGDYSLIKKKNKKSVSIKVENINYFFNKISKKFLLKNIVYKSDTQGYDEKLILSLNKKILNKIDILIMEVSNFDYLKKNNKKFLNLIKEFNHIENSFGNKLEEQDIIKLIKERKEFNILLSRN